MAHLEKEVFIQSVLEEVIDRILCEVRRMYRGKVQITLRLQDTSRAVHVWASGKNFTVRITREGNVHIDMESYNPHRSYSEQIYTYEPSEESQTKFLIDFRQRINFLVMIFLEDWRGWFGDYLRYLEKYHDLEQVTLIMRYEYYLKNDCLDESIDMLDELRRG